MQGTLKNEAGRDSNSKLALIALLLGSGSLAALLIAVVISISVELIGVVSLFRSLVLPLSLAAVVVGAIARNRTLAENVKERKQATLGLIFGAVALGLVIITMLVVFIIFIPMLFI